MGEMVMNTYELAEEGIEIYSDIPNSLEYKVFKAYIDLVNKITELKQTKPLSDGFSLNPIPHPHNNVDVPERLNTDALETVEIDLPFNKFDEVLDKAFNYYCETDEGVLRFDLELREEWKQDQLQRWKEAFRKAWD